MAKEVGWGIVGPGRIARAFAEGLGEAKGARLAAVGSRSAERARQFGAAFGLPAEACHGDYDALIADPAVEAVYIATPHPFHYDQAVSVIAAGKHVLVEKPAGLNRSQVVRMVAAAEQANLLFLEGYMYLLHPQIARLLDVLASGELGEVRHIRARFGFSAPIDPDSRLYNIELAGGGILDVGGYPLSFARLVAGHATRTFAQPEEFLTAGRVGPTGVDEIALAHALFPGDITAELSCSVAVALGERAEVICSGGSVVLDEPWLPGRDAKGSDATLLVRGPAGEREESIAAPQMLYAYEAEAASAAIRAGQGSVGWPAISPEASVQQAAILEGWLAGVGAGWADIYSLR